MSSTFLTGVEKSLSDKMISKLVVATKQTLQSEKLIMLQLRLGHLQTRVSFGVATQCDAKILTDSSCMNCLVDVVFKTQKYPAP